MKECGWEHDIQAIEQALELHVTHNYQTPNFDVRKLFLLFTRQWYWPTDFRNWLLTSYSIPSQMKYFIIVLLFCSSERIIHKTLLRHQKTFSHSVFLDYPAWYSTVQESSWGGDIRICADANIIHVWVRVL